MKYRIILFLLIIFSFSQCAKVGRPTGGDKDEIAPISISATPDFGSVNFNKKKIKIHFDEYIKFKNLNDQLIVSPPLQHPSIITPMGTASKFISIEIKDTLQENTTYSFNFGNAIEDFSEGNPLKQFRYVFSTGDYLDSLSVSGVVKDAFNKENLSNISVMLYKIDEMYNDSTIYKEKPNYLANTLEGNSFTISNIKAGKYKMIALKDVRGNLQYDSKEDKIGFLDDITIPTDTTYLLKLYKEKNKFSIKKLIEVDRNHVLIPFEGELASEITAVLDKKMNPIVYHSYKDEVTDTLHVWHNAIDKDTLFVAIKDKDSTHNHVVRLRSKEKDTLRVTPNFKKTLALKDSLFLYTNIPIFKIIKSNISFFDKDSIKVPFTVNISESKTKIHIDFDKKQNERYQLQFLPNTFTDYLGEKNDTINLAFNTRSEDTYGEISIDLTNQTSNTVILQLLNDKKEILETLFVVENKEVLFSLLEPGKYSVRAIIDSNNNKKWDSGSFLDHKQPEIVIYFPTTINLRANWTVTEKMIITD